ncbi:MAG: septum formation initiator family protein [Flavobacteriaceae bacterium]|tara:strand:+ start:237 stop:563 length:327 start_codon:yes stop_codon:yes gene_type:complete
MMKKKFKAILSKLNPYRNIYYFVSILFIFWMLFFDTNSWLIHRVLDKDIKVLEVKKDFYNNEIESDQEQIRALETPEGLEAFARENYKMKRINEDIYIIASDTVNQLK